MKNFINVVFVVGLSLWATSAFAGNVYTSLSGGVNFLNDTTQEFEIAVPDQDVSYETGFSVGGAVGYDFGKYRTEFEIAYRQNDLNQTSIGPVSFDLTGDVSAISYMFNAFYDVENNSPITPYIGGGVGIAKVSINDASFVGSALENDDSDTVFAWKIGVGAAYEVTPNISLTGGYELFATADLDFEDGLGNKFEADYTSHNVNLGLRYAF
jgi:opacity protein-like surface antigen